MNELFNLGDAVAGLVYIFVFAMAFGFLMGVVRYMMVGVFESNK